ncbi:MAG TPA: malto-oligosyltrehalose synthase, partial [Sphingobacteriaceae bacterium]
MFNPIATYRLQFHKDFNFDDFEAVIPYLKALGAGTVYASPVFRSVPGSNHGYDGTDPLMINPEIGTLEQLIALSAALKESGIGWLQDIVPNHMAFHPENIWLTDVLEKGVQSVYRPFFDIIGDHPDGDGKLMVPFLGDSPDQVIERGELKVACRGRLVLQYFDQSYPLNRRSYERILRLGAEPADQAVDDLRSELRRLHQVEDPEIYSREWNEFLLRLQALMKNPGSGGFIGRCLDQVNSRPDLLKELAGDQEYRLCHWSDTDRQINYRRFFTVNSLICMNMQDPRVFGHYHRLIGELVNTGVFNGLRVDHVDGLSDPSGYLEQLREMAGGDVYLTVEKILEPGEKLPAGWPVEGSTGYDFLGMVNNLLTRKESEPAFTAYYRQLTGQQTPIAGQIAEKKRKILYENMAGELENLVRMFPGTPRTLIEPDDLRDAIGAFLIACPVYRYYGNRIPLEPAERTAVRNILDAMRAAPVPPRATGALEEVLLYDGQDPKYARQVLRFYQRLMQFSGPLMAKGVEDTLMYTFNRFIGHNEVGDSPETFGIGVDGFHRLMQQRQTESPMSMNATSTHDTKRGEDVRARLSVLTDLAAEWLQLVETWREMNAELKTEAGPDENDEYFIYQSLIGAYPMPGEDASGFPERMREYLVKALREGKVRSGWTRPDEAYEKAAGDFAAALLDPRQPFWAGFSAFHRKVAGFGIVNSLVQLVLKFTCPGIPDVYQGTEHWDLSFVDPDNRRPVDFAVRGRWLQELQSADPSVLWEHRYDGRIKVWLTAQLFRLRRMNVRLFTDGAYIPLTAEGKYKDHICSFA